MSKEPKNKKDIVKTYVQFMNENVNENENDNTNIDSYFINRLSEQIKTFDGVINVDTSHIKYDENDLIYYYNNGINVIFDDTSFFGFKLTNFNQHDSGANRDKFIKHLDKSTNKLEEYLSKIDSIKNTIPKIKKVVDYVDSLELENNINIKKVDYSFANNKLMITIYKNY